jgi:nitronate monooxygenase
MSIPTALQISLTLPVIAAPMFLCSGPDLVCACCSQGIIGTFPALNQRSSAGFAQWLAEVEQRREQHRLSTGAPAAAYGVNLIVHKTNPRLEADLDICIEHRVPLVITSLGAASRLAERIHAYGGLVFHDVTTIKHAHKAADAGVDGLIAVCAGAGGHAGTLSSLVFVNELRRFFDKTLVLAGGLSTGHDVATAIRMGADLAYMGTRFIATRESMASSAYKNMIVASTAEDIVYTPAVSGIPANFLRASLEAAGFDMQHLSIAAKADIGKELAQGGQHTAKAWRDIWSAGQGVGMIDDIPSVEELVRRLHKDFNTPA